MNRLVATLTVVWLAAGWAVCVCGAAAVSSQGPVRSCCVDASEPAAPAPLQQPQHDGCPHCSMSVQAAIADAVVSPRAGSLEPMPTGEVAHSVSIVRSSIAHGDVVGGDLSPPDDVHSRLACWCILTL